MMGYRIFILCFTTSALLAGCSHARSWLALNQSDKTGPIANPFTSYAPQASQEASQGLVIRSKSGAQSVELELPRDKSNPDNLVVPFSGGQNRAPASIFGETESPLEIDNSYKNHRPSQSDREISKTFAHNTFEEEAHRGNIEKDLYLAPSDDGTGELPASYLAQVDRIKQLFRLGRYEAALLEADEALRLFPTDAKLYEIRGTLFDRIGKRELALKSWTQALRFDPKNEGLRKYLEQKQMAVSVNPP
jgi:tetratricopeptide (TPR) repeat protein